MYDQTSNSFSIGDFNSVYHYLEDNPGILLPVSAFASGYIAGGLPVAIVGSSAVLLEQGYNYYTGQNSTFISTSFLTYGVFGAALSDISFGGKNIILPAISAVTGYFINQGYLENDPEIVDHLSTALMGQYLCGPWCAAIGFAASVIDSYAYEYGYYQAEKKYLTTTIALASMVKLPGSYLGSKYGAIYQKALFASVPLLSWAHEEYNLQIVNINYSEQIKHYYQVKAAFVEVLGKEKAEQHLYNHIVVNSGLNIAKMYSWNNVIKNYDCVRRSITPTGVQSDLDDPLRKFAGSVLSYITVGPVTEQISKFYINKAYIDMRRQKQDMWLNESVPIAIENGNVNHTEIQSLGGNFNQNAWALCKDGIEANIKIINNFQEFTYITAKLGSEGFSDVLMSIFMANSFSNYITRILGKWRGEYSVKLKDLTFKEDTLYKQVNQYARQIAETDGSDFTKKQLNDISFAKLEVEIAKDNLASIFQFWMNIKGWGEYIISFCASAKLFFDKVMNFEHVAVNAYLASHLGLFSWRDDNSAENENLIDAMNSIQKYMNALSTAIQYSESGIKREFDESLESMQINLSIQVEKTKQPIAEFDNIILNTGKIYSFTGASGSGKSSSISKIIGIDGNGIAGNGAITYPFSDISQILYVPQKDYIPSFVNLCQVVLYPEWKDESANCNGKADKIVEWLNFLRFDPDEDKTYIVEDLEAEKDWNKILSGGQLKKLMLIRAFLKDAELLIFDEIFNGMDPDSIKQAQQLIKDFAEGRIIVVVDHNAASNNEEGFYSGGNLQIRDKVATVTDDFGEEGSDICLLAVDSLGSVNVNASGFDSY